MLLQLQQHIWQELPHLTSIALLSSLSRLLPLSSSSNVSLVLLQLQQHIWQETLHFTSAALPSSTGPAAAPASTSCAETHVRALLGSQSPQGLRQKLRLLKQFQSWQQEDDVLNPLALPRLPVQVKQKVTLLLDLC